MAQSGEKRSASDIARGVWSTDEHDRFLETLQRYPDGPWRAIAAHIGSSRSIRQVQTHAQKYHEKVARRLRGLRKARRHVQRTEHRIDDEMLEICSDLQREYSSLWATSSPALLPATQPSVHGTASLGYEYEMNAASGAEAIAVDAHRNYNYNYNSGAIDQAVAWGMAALEEAYIIDAPFVGGQQQLEETYSTAMDDSLALLFAAT